MENDRLVDSIQETRDKILQLSVHQHVLGSLLAQEATGVRKGNLIVMSRGKRLVSGASIRVAWVHNIFIEGIEMMMDFSMDSVKSNVIMEVRVMNKTGHYSPNITRITIGDFIDVSDRGEYPDPITGITGTSRGPIKTRVF